VGLGTILQEVIPLAIQVRVLKLTTQCHKISVGMRSIHFTGGLGTILQEVIPLAIQVRVL
jgi:hypothetical protein